MELVASGIWIGSMVPFWTRLPIQSWAPMTTSGALPGLRGGHEVGLQLGAGEDLDGHVDAVLLAERLADRGGRVAAGAVADPDEELAARGSGGVAAARCRRRSRESPPPQADRTRPVASRPAAIRNVRLLRVMRTPLCG